MCVLVPNLHTYPSGTLHSAGAQLVGLRGQREEGDGGDI